MAPSTTAHAPSSALSSASDAPAVKKKFACTFPACGKSFSRSEHLHRHALNHKDGNHTCLRCMAHFRRRDLLDRHTARHNEKDDEAGGEGLGILATRKRLWRDADGNIVNARRPSYTQEGAKRRQIKWPERKGSTSSESSRASKGRRTGSAMSRESSSASWASSASVTSVADNRGMKLAPHDDNDHHHHHHHPHPHSGDSSLLSQSQPHSWLEVTKAPPLARTDSEMKSTEPKLSLGAKVKAEADTDAEADAEADIDLADELDTLYEDTWPILYQTLPEMISGSSANHTPTSSISSSTSSINSSPILGRHLEYPANPSWELQSFQTFMGAVAEMPYEDPFRSETDLYEWPAWNNSQVLMSRCWEEKFDPFEERKSEWARLASLGEGGGTSGSVFRRASGLGTC